MGHPEHCFQEVEGNERVHCALGDVDRIKYDSECNAFNIVLGT